MEGHKFLVIGGAGFIGSRIVEMLLEQGNRVIVVDNLSTGKMSNLDGVINDDNFKFVEGDIRDYSLLREVTIGVDYCINQAALVSVPKSIEKPLLNNDINVTGFSNILEACRINNVKRLVYASSSAVYGDEISRLKREDKLGQIISPYALSKLVNEQLADLYHRVYNLSSVGLRYFNVYGPKQDPSSVYSGVISIFFERLFNDEEINIYGDGQITRDFIFVDDVARANIMACQSDDCSSAEVFNIGTGEATSITTLAKTIQQFFDSTSKINYLPPRVGDILHSCADVEKAHNSLNFTSKYSLQEGLKRTYNYLKKMRF